MEKKIDNIHNGVVQIHPFFRISGAMDFEGESNENEFHGKLKNANVNA